MRGHAENPADDAYARKIHDIAAKRKQSHGHHQRRHYQAGAERDTRHMVKHALGERKAICARGPQPPDDQRWKGEVRHSHTKLYAKQTASEP